MNDFDTYVLRPFKTGISTAFAVREAHARGESVREIADATGLSRARVRRLLGIPEKPQK